MAKRLTYGEIEKYINGQYGNGCELQTSKEEFYDLLKNNYASQVLLKIKCNCGNMFENSYNGFKALKTKQCNECGNKAGGLRRKHSFEYVYNYINSNTPYTLIDTTYINNSSRLSLQDENMYLYYINFNNLQMNKKPECFHPSNPYTLQDIKLWCKLNNKPFELLSDNYINANIKILWQCSKTECLEVFEMPWCAILTGSKCPYCSGVLPSRTNNLKVMYSEISNEWNYKRNKYLPENYTYGSSKKVWWICNNCGHEWKTAISCRTGRDKTSCPECNKSKGENKIKNFLNLKEVYYIAQKEFDGLLGVGNGNLSYDFYLPYYNLLIEYQGEFHKKQQKHISKKKFKNQQEHDKRKREYAKTNNINLLEIWYWEYDKVEEILEKLLE